MDSVLVSGASGIIGYGILKSLRKSHPGVRLIGTSVYDRSVAPSFCDVFEKAPLTTHDEYIPWLLDLVKRYSISVLIPGIEIDVIAWSKRREEIERSGARALLNNPELIRLCSDKWLFYQELVKHGSPYAIPTCLQLSSLDYSYPVIVKPRKGSGSKGVKVVENFDELEKYVIGKPDNEIMIQPLVGTADHEYTTSAFFDRDSNLCAFNTLKRRLSTGGFTEVAEVAGVEGIGDALLHFAEIFKPVGPTNFQFRLNGCEIKLLEINPRISSATSIRTAFGYNESAMSVDFLLDGRVPIQPQLRKGYAVRYTEDSIFYDSSDF